MRTAVQDLGAGAGLDKAEIRKLFDRLDVDGSGSIKTKEIEEVCKALNMKQTPTELKKFMSDIDVNKDGMVDFAEFETAFSTPAIAASMRLDRERSSEKRKQAIMGNTRAFGITSYAGCVLRQKLSRSGLAPRDVDRELNRNQEAGGVAIETSKEARETSKEERERWSEALTLAENLFFMMDTSGSGWIPNSVAADMLEFLLPDAQPESLVSLLDLSTSKSTPEKDEQQLQQPTILDDDQGIVRWEFVQLCNRFLDLSVEGTSERLKMAAENFQFAKAQEARFYNIRWQRLAAKLDYYSMVIGLLMYSTFLLWMFNVDFSDDYAENPDSHWGEHEFTVRPLSASAVFWMMLPCIVTSAITVLYVLVTRRKPEDSVDQPSDASQMFKVMAKENKQAQLAKSQSARGAMAEALQQTQQGACTRVHPEPEQSSASSGLSGNASEEWREPGAPL